MIAARISPATFERQRSRALAAGPSDDAVSDALLNLRADRSELIDAMGRLDGDCHSELDGLRVDALITGDWTAYGEAWRHALDAQLKPRARAIATRELVRSWDDAAEAISSRLDAAFDRMFGVAS